MNAPFKDHFSAHADSYTAYRPGYPMALFDWLADQAPACHSAWDCATGNGQAALGLARRFKHVVATDASEEQIRNVVPADNINYRTENAAKSSLQDSSVDLLTVAQAYHWFDHPAFLQEVRRVLARNGILAIWTYALARVAPSIDEIVRGFYDGMIAPYWPPERKLVERGYRDLSFPWPELAAPAFAIELDWNLEAFEGYLRTWSAVRRYMTDEQADPVEQLHSDLLAAWGNEATSRRVHWPIVLRAFRVEANMG